MTSNDEFFASCLNQAAIHGRLEELVAQSFASQLMSGCTPYDMAQHCERIAALIVHYLANEDEVWDLLLPGPGRDPSWTIRICDILSSESDDDLVASKVSEELAGSQQGQRGPTLMVNEHIRVNLKDGHAISGRYLGKDSVGDIYIEGTVGDNIGHTNIIPRDNISYIWA